MKRFILSLVILVVVSAPPASAQISSPDAREEALRKTDRIVPIPATEMIGKFAEALNPFFRDAPAVVPQEEIEVPGVRFIPVAAPAPRQVLREIAERIRPTGVMQMGERSMLLFGERRVSAGETLAVEFQGTQYQIEIVSVGPRTFTMRLNQEVITKRIQ
jgi:hypothetical protein